MVEYLNPIKSIHPGIYIIANQDPLMLSDLL